MRILKKQGKIANRKSPAGRRGISITNKIFKVAKLLQKIFSCKRKKEKKSDFESIGGYLCYKGRKWCELTPEEQVIYNDYFFSIKHPDYTAMLERTQSQYIYQTLKKQSYENNE